MASRMGLLDRYTFEDVLREKYPNGTSGALIELPAEASVQDALTLIRTHNILAVAVWGKKGRWLGAGATEAYAGDKQYIGIVSILDIVNYVLSLLPDDPSAGSPAPALGGAHPNLSSKRVIELIGASDETRSLWVARPDTPLRLSLAPIGRGIHRVLVPSQPEVVDQALGARGPSPSSGQVTLENTFRLVTQTDVIRFLLAHIKEDADLERTLQESVERLGLVGEARGSFVVTADVTSSAAVILKQMAAHSLNAVPVVNGHLNGVLVGTLSISDLRSYLAAQDHDDLMRIMLNLQALSVAQFLQKVKPESPAGHAAGMGNGVWCHSETPVVQVMRRAVDARVHRLWVVDKESVPLGVVTYTDLIALVGAEAEARQSS
ncbi:hypothetical protein HDU85_007140 [Gaertneriomyces sp. JEL0708]|nr:hypothetical protein HDU85_007140 [Gaertneriomyces sp. JEL0708]